jgi:signal transduction histidine kinase
MKTKQQALANSYAKALAQHLSASNNNGVAAALRIGERAISLGLGTLELASIHQHSIIPCLLHSMTAAERDLCILRAEGFFAHAITPLEKTHKTALESNAHLKVMVATLKQRTKELDASNEELKQEILQRKTTEESLRTSENTSSKLLMKAKEMQEQLRLLSRRLLSAQEEERRRISRELHDVIAQALTGINLKLASLKTQSKTDTQAFQQQITETQTLIEQSVEIVHRFARDLRPTVLDDLGIIAALNNYLQVFLERTGIRAKLTAFGKIESLANDILTGLFRITQEALSNVAQHANATAVEVVITQPGQVIRLEIKDNGQGFVVDDLTLTDHAKRLGLLGMKERAEMMDGKFSIESAPGRGTTVRVDLPASSVAITTPPTTP